MKPQKNAKQRIADALITIMKTKELEQITVSELAAEAQVSRSTYYYYFYLVEDVVEYIMEPFLEKMRQVVEPDESIVLYSEGENEIPLRQELENFFEFIIAHVDEYKCIIKSKYKIVFYESLVQMSLNYYKNYAHYMYQKDGKFVRMTNTQREYWDIQAATSVIGAMEQWADRGFKETSEELVQLTCGLYGTTKVIISRR